MIETGIIGLFAVPVEVQLFCFVDPETTSLCDLAQAWAVSASTAHAAPARRMIGAFLHADAMQWKKVVLT